jgi:hypothetical protein
MPNRPSSRRLSYVGAAILKVLGVRSFLRVESLGLRHGRVWGCWLSLQEFACKDETF